MSRQASRALSVAQAAGAPCWVAWSDPARLQMPGRTGYLPKRSANALRLRRPALDFRAKGGCDEVQGSLRGSSQEAKRIEPIQDNYTDSTWFDMV